MTKHNIASFAVWLLRRDCPVKHPGHDNYNRFEWQAVAEKYAEEVGADEEVVEKIVKIMTGGV